MRQLRLLVASATLCVWMAATSEAASLRVAPVILDLTAPTAASSVRVWNDAERPINVQIRVFRWSQSGGEDRLEPTTDVVASPPITTLQPGSENLVRIVRTTKRPVEGEESYRLLVDELPQPGERTAGTVVLVVRYSLPVFFAAPEAAGAEVSWSVRRQDGGFLVTAQNSGTERLRVSNLELSGGAAGRRDGLVGYVLGDSSMSWFVPGSGGSGGSVTISADGEAGRFNATARLQGG
jgi:fimbrial chaperone protein